MKTIIAGGRDLPETMTHWRAIDEVHAKLGITEVVCGGARGGDTIGRLWAEDRGIPVKLFPADWKQHGRAAGPIRNQAMAEYADALIALPGGKGTANMVFRMQGRAHVTIVAPNATTDMISRAQRRGIRVVKVEG